MNEKKELNKQVSETMATINALDIPEALKRKLEGKELSVNETKTTFVQTETETGEHDKPLAM